MLLVVALVFMLVVARFGGTALGFVLKRPLEPIEVAVGNSFLFAAGGYAIGVYGLLDGIGSVAFGGLAGGSVALFGAVRSVRFLRRHRAASSRETDTPF